MQIPTINHVFPQIDTINHIEIWKTQIFGTCLFPRQTLDMNVSYSKIMNISNETV